MHDDSLQRGGNIRSAVSKALTDVNDFIFVPTLQATADERK